MPLTVVFDLDGTLVDTAPDLVFTLNKLFAREGLAPLRLEFARNLIGGGVRPLIERGLRAEGRTLPAEEIDRLFVGLIADYSEHIADRSRPFPGLAGALDELASEGAILAVCTNKLEHLSVKLLDALGLSGRFAAICGQDTFPMKKPHPEMLRRTIARAGGDAEHAVMVCDSANDIDTARAAGVPVIAVDFGYSAVPVSQLGPDRVISNFADLPRAVREVCGARFAPV